MRIQPVAGTDGTLYVALAAAEGSSAGGRIVALDRSGHVRAGWPVILKRPGSAFWLLTPNPTGGLWALAIEPEANDFSATMLSISPTGSVRWTTTIVEP